MSDGTFYLGTLVVMCVSILALARLAAWTMRDYPHRDAAIKGVDWDPVDEHFATTVRDEELGRRP